MMVDVNQCLTGGSPIDNPIIRNNSIYSSLGGRAPDQKEEVAYAET